MSANHDEQSSTSSEPMEVPQQFDGVLALGRKLVEELGHEPSVDTLGRWMAHYIAELMDQASTVPPDERLAAQRRCFDAVVELWRHRAALPLGARPLEAMDPVVRAIASLDPDAAAHRYARPFWAGVKDQAPESQAVRWLKVADNTDYAARLLIGYALGKAADVALDSSAEWVKLATDAGLDVGPSEILIQLVGSAEHADESGDGERAIIRGRLKQLEYIAEIVATVESDLRDRLEAEEDK